MNECCPVIASVEGPHRDVCLDNAVVCIILGHI